MPAPLVVAKSGAGILAGRPFATDYSEALMKRHILAIGFVTTLAIAAAAPTHSVTVTEGTNVNVTLSPDHATIIMDLQETLWSLPVAGGADKRLTDPFLEPARPRSEERRVG